MKICKYVLFISLLIWLLFITGCSAKNKAAIREMTLSSLYDAESYSFVLDGYAPKTGWRKLCEALDISLDELEKDELGYRIDNVLEIYPKASGRIWYGDILLNGRRASITYEFYCEKLCGVSYSFDFDEESNQDRTEVAIEFDAVLSDEFSDFVSYNDGEIDGFNYTYRRWFVGSKGSMSCLTFSTSADSVSGELMVALSVICDVPGQELASTHYSDEFGSP